MHSTTSSSGGHELDFRFFKNGVPAKGETDEKKNVIRENEIIGSTLLLFLLLLLLLFLLSALCGFS